MLERGVLVLRHGDSCRGTRSTSRNEKETRMAEGPEEPAADTPLHGCMPCKARQPYTVEALPNGNTIWRCRACAHVVNLIPGTYSTPEGQASGEVPT